jgi:uncharacterized protein (DUF58 family)
VLTGRGWWFLFFAATTLLAGVVWLGAFTSAIPLLGLTLCGYLAWEWFFFQYRARAAGDRLRLDRELLQVGRAVPSAWVGSPVTVRLTITNTGRASLPFIRIVDRLPSDIALSPEVNQLDTSLAAGGRVVLEYTLTPTSPGQLRFEGATIHTADLAGLFYRRQFLAVPREYLVMPPLADHDARRRTTKRFNALPPPGIHRLRRPGSGDELLDLREYRPGDPPKMIAWKASARRDVLMTKEIESDVPVRMVLFVDATNSARIGPPGFAPIRRFVDVASAMTQAAVGNRDLVGMQILRESGSETLAPARTKIHVLRILKMLTVSASELPQPQALDAELTARFAFPVASELYPDRLQSFVNSRPFGLFWLPISDSRWQYVMWGLLGLPTLFFSPWILELLANISATFAPAGKTWMLFFGLSIAPGVLAILLWLLHGVRGFLQPRAGRTSRRKQLAMLFAGQDAAEPILVERYLNDDVEFTRRASRFLHVHHVRLPLAMYDRDGTNRYRNPEKLTQLTHAITRSLSLARDNELYVVLAELLELSQELEPLLKTIRAVRARHHAIIVLMPWPADVPREMLPETEPLKLGTLVKQVLIRRTHEQYQHARQHLVQAGATVMLLDATDSVQLVLDRLDRLRTARVRR